MLIVGVTTIVSSRNIDARGEGPPDSQNHREAVGARPSILVGFTKLGDAVAKQYASMPPPCELTPKPYQEPRALFHHPA